MKHKTPDMILLFISLILLAIGLVMMFSASSSTAMAITKAHPDPFYFLKRQMIWLFLGFIGMFIVYGIDFQRLERFIPWIYGLNALALVAVLIPHIGSEANGARRWLAVGPIGFQPSEFLKITLVLFVSWFLTRNGRISTSFTKTMIPLLVLTLPVIALVFKEPDFGTAFLLALVVGAMICLSGMRLTQLLLLGSGIIPVGIFFMMTAKYRMSRWSAFFHPWKDPLGSGYHIIQGLIALGSGGLLGLGLGASRQKYFYLPEQHTDYIFAVLGEEGGFIATFFVIILFIFLSARGMNIALKQKDAYSKLIAAGLTVSMIGQALLNMGMVMSVFPPAGVALPFFSYGGSSLMVTMMMIGILLNLSRIAPARRLSDEMQEKIFLERT